jgi:hypothetical protein
MSSKCLFLIFPLSSGTEKRHWRLDPVNRQGVSYLFISYKLPHRQCSNLSFDILAAGHQNTLKTKLKLNSVALVSIRRHSERDCHRSTITHLSNADMPTLSNDTEASAHCCHGKTMLKSSRTSLSDLVRTERRHKKLLPSFLFKGALNVRNT